MIGRCIHNNHPIEYLRILERSIPKGKFSIKATPPIRSNARVIIIVLNKIIYFMAKSQAKVKKGNVKKRTNTSAYYSKYLAAGEDYRILLRFATNHAI